MWNDPARLNQLSGWLFGLAAVVFLLLLARGLTEGLFPFRQVTVLGAHQADTRRDVPERVRQLRGGFFTLDLERARATLEQLPWVSHASVRRLWPNRLVVELTEHVPAAAWNGQQTLDTHGRLFPVKPWPSLPRIHAPEGTQLEVARRLGEFHHLLRDAGLRLEAVQVSPRRSWRLVLAGGVSLELGRERMEERVRRFVAFYPNAVRLLGPMTQIDLRYPNGFAAHKPPAPGKPTRGAAKGTRTA
jgi:cell division protein FtsQ